MVARGYDDTERCSAQPGPRRPHARRGVRRAWPWIVLTAVAGLVIVRVVRLVARPADDAG